jgi:hypothetical protein
MAQSTGTVGRYGRRSKIHLLSLRLEFLLRRFLSAHTVSDEGRLLKSQNEPYKMEERITRFFIFDRSAEGPARLEQENKVWLDDIGLLAEAVSSHFTDLTDPSKTVLPSKLNPHCQTGSQMLLREAVAVI